jgi:hypothetical protein
MTERTTENRKTRWLFAAAAVILGSAMFSAVAGGAFTRSEARDYTEGVLNFDKMQRFSGYAVYHAGGAVEGLPLDAVLQRDDSAVYVSYIYGTCENKGGNACAPPAEVQTWPACRRHLSLYNGPYSPTPENTTVRGAPAAFFEGGRRLEIQTGKSTVVIFGRSRGEVLRIAEALRGANVPVEPGGSLPSAAPGARTGSVACGF